MTHVRGETAEFLTERHRHRILKMRAPGLEHMSELASLGLERVGKAEGRLQEARQHQQNREPCRGRKHVIGGLAHVDVVVRMDPGIGPARFPETLGGQIREHLVRVHVVRRTGASLVDVDDELIAIAARENLVRGCHDRKTDVPIQTSELDVGDARPPA